MLLREKNAANRFIAAVWTVSLGSNFGLLTKLLWYWQQQKKRTTMMRRTIYSYIMVDRLNWLYLLCFFVFCVRQRMHIYGSTRNHRRYFQWKPSITNFNLTQFCLSEIDYRIDGFHHLWCFWFYFRLHANHFLEGLPFNR